jgi:cytidyltransferase-like protein
MATLMKKIVLVTGGFDPLHSGHISYFRSAKSLGDTLIVGINSDAWLERKKGRAFMSFEERVEIIKNIKFVDDIVRFNDDDGTAKDAIEKIRFNFPNDIIIFANGGDRTKENIPEMDVKDNNLEFAFGIGGDNKLNSSSWILEEWKAPKTKRPWGYYRVLHDVDGTKVKELTIEPGKSLSMQKHQLRSEYWIVTEGKCKVEKEFGTTFVCKHDTVNIPKNEWHQLSNPFNNPCRIVEIQYGSKCDEDDIERK